MSNPGFPLILLRTGVLLVACAVLGACGQKGDLYRPGATQKLAAATVPAHRA